MSLKAHFSRFLGADPDRLHFAAHSHHLWPDVTFDAQVDDAGRTRRGWPTASGQPCSARSTQPPKVMLPARSACRGSETIAFGPNTHGFVIRLLSCLPPGQTIRALTTDSEFHSFARQIRRLEEDGIAVVTRVPVEPFLEFRRALRRSGCGAAATRLIYFSHVFYNSGYAVPDLAAVVGAIVDKEAIGGRSTAITAFSPCRATSPLRSRPAPSISRAATSTPWRAKASPFVHAPSGQALRPRNTGWFASFSALAQPGQDEVAYGAEGDRFLGATFDPCRDLPPECRHWSGSPGPKPLGHGDSPAEYTPCKRISRRDWIRLGSKRSGPISCWSRLSEPNRGHFLTFRTQQAEAIHRRLLDANVITDYRGDRLRFGFGIYHDPEDIERLIDVLARELS